MASKFLIPLLLWDDCWFILRSKLSKPKREIKKLTWFSEIRFSTKRKSFLSCLAHSPSPILKKNPCSSEKNKFPKWKQFLITVVSFFFHFVIVFSILKQLLFLHLLVDFGIDHDHNVAFFSFSSFFVILIIFVWLIFRHFYIFKKKHEK